MLKRLFSIVTGLGMLFASFPAPVLADSVTDRVLGRILLQVEDHGEAWYVSPVDNSRYYLKDGPAAYEALRTFGLGITNADLAKIPVAGESATSSVSWDLVARLKGRILLQVENHGEAWYVNPADGYRTYLKDGAAAYSLMRNFGLGITNADLSTISTHTASPIPGSESIDTNDSEDDIFDDYLDDDFSDYSEDWDDEDFDDSDWGVVYEFEVESADECYDFETFDSQEMICYLECESEAECDEIYASVEENEDALDEMSDDYFGDDSGDDSAISEENSSEEVIVYYDINNDSIVNPVLGSQSGQYPDYANNSSIHDQIWGLFAGIVPSQKREAIDSFALFSDGEAETLAYVEPLDNDSKTWRMAIDVVDSFVDGELETKELPLTLIHEYAHVLSLSDDQLTQSSDCSEQYNSGDRCFEPSAYLYAFITDFWGSSSVAQYDENNFITDYAATDSAEDFAESFAYFVVSSAPTGARVVDKKIQFFYRYPELVTLRNLMRVGLSR